MGAFVIVYTPLWETMKKKGITSYYLIYKQGIATSTMSRLRKNLPCNTTTINDLCRILDCRVEDIIQYIPDPAEAPKP